MTMVTLHSIQALSDKSYLVTFRAESDEERAYVIAVDSSSDIPIVTWSDEFAQAVGLNITPAKSALEAVRAMHGARAKPIDVDLSPR